MRELKEIEEEVKKNLDDEVERKAIAAITDVEKKLRDNARERNQLLAQKDIVIKKILREYEIGQ